MTYFSHICHFRPMTQPNPQKAQIFGPFPTQPNPTRGSTQPTDNSAIAYYCGRGSLVKIGGLARTQNIGIHTSLIPISTVSRHCLSHPHPQNAAPHPIRFPRQYCTRDAEFSTFCFQKKMAARPLKGNEKCIPSQNQKHQIKNTAHYRNLSTQTNDQLEVCALCGDADQRRVCRELHFV